MINIQEQKKHTKFSKIYRILSKYDKSLCKENNLANKFTTKRSKI